MIARLICRLFGHKRGVRISCNADESIATFRCERCMTTWTRKVYPRKVKA